MWVRFPPGTLLIVAHLQPNTADHPRSEKRKAGRIMARESTHETHMSQGTDLLLKDVISQLQVNALAAELLSAIVAASWLGREAVMENAQWLNSGGIARLHC